MISKPLPTSMSTPNMYTLTHFPSSFYNFTPIFPPKPNRFATSATPKTKHKTLIPVQDLARTIKLGNIQTIKHFNNLFNNLVLTHNLEFAYSLYSSLPTFDFNPNNLTFSILVKFYVKKNDPNEAKNVLKYMINNGYLLEFNKVKILTQIINLFCKKGKLKEAFEVFDMMGIMGCEGSVVTYNCLLKGLCFVGRVEEAYEMLVRVRECAASLSLRLDVYSYTAVMDGFCKVGRSDEALELLDEAIEAGLDVGEVSYNTILNGYFKEGRPMEGFGLLERMRARGCVPDYVSYSTLLHGLLQWGEVRAAVKVFDEMLGVGFGVDERMMNTLLRGVCRRSRVEKDFLKKAYQVFDEMCMRGCDIDPCAYELMIEAFCNGNEMDKAYVNLCEMIRMGLSPRTFTLNIVVRGLSNEGKIEKAMSVLVYACRGRSKMLDKSAFDVLIKEMNRQGMFTNATCVYCVALKNGVMPLRKPRQVAVLQ